MELVAQKWAVTVTAVSESLAQVMAKIPAAAAAAPRPVAAIVMSKTVTSPQSWVPPTPPLVPAAAKPNPGVVGAGRRAAAVL